MSSESYHEPAELLSEETKNLHRAVVSLTEELEAVDWYQQRAEACSDPELAAILIHNRDEEIEHAMMVLEWLRRNHPTVDAQARTYLFSQGPITELEEGAEDGAGKDAGAGSDAGGGHARGASTSHGCLGIGSLKEEV